MYWIMHILHEIRGYTLIGADYKLTIFSAGWLAGTFCADTPAAEAVVHHGGVRFKFPLF
jgi:hypothetical protein